jgi:hypothetical protein
MISYIEEKCSSFTISGEELSSYLNQLKKLWEQFQTSFYTQLMLTDDDNELNSLQDMHKKTMEVYVRSEARIEAKLAKHLANGHESLAGQSEMVSHLSEMLENTTKAMKIAHDTVASAKGKSPFSIPKLTIKPFSGKIEEWVSFKDMFKQTIMDNQELNDVQKMQYLKSFLTGQAKELLLSMSIMANCFEAAWDKLVKRYENDDHHQSASLRLHCSSTDEKQQLSLTRSPIFSSASGTLANLQTYIVLFLLSARHLTTILNASFGFFGGLPSSVCKLACKSDTVFRKNSSH